MRMEIDMEKNPSTSRKRRSLNVMLRDQSAKKTRSTVEEDVEDQNEAHEDQNEAHEDQNETHEDQNEGHEDQNEAHEDMDILSSPASSGADPMVCEAKHLLCMWLAFCVCGENTFYDSLDCGTFFAVHRSR